VPAAPVPIFALSTTIAIMERSVVPRAADKDGSAIARITAIIRAAVARAITWIGVTAARDTYAIGIAGPRTARASRKAQRCRSQNERTERGLQIRVHRCLLRFSPL
jgi:hypothetical protein